MKSNSASWKMLLLFGCLLALRASVLEAADVTQARPESPPSFDRVTTYLKERDGATTLQNTKVEKELKGRLYSGVISVWDVTEEGGQIIIQGDGGGGGYYGLLHFKVQDPALKERAGQIRKADAIFITARLDQFWVQSSGYLNVRDKYIAEFQAVDVQPRKQSGPKQ